MVGSALADKWGLKSPLPDSRPKILLMYRRKPMGNSGVIIKTLENRYDPALIGGWGVLRMLGTVLR
jgi:hypothetical protein